MTFVVAMFLFISHVLHRRITVKLFEIQDLLESFLSNRVPAKEQEQELGREKENLTEDDELLGVLEHTYKLSSQLS